MTEKARSLLLGQNRYQSPSWNRPIAKCILLIMVGLIVSSDLTRAQSTISTSSIFTTNDGVSNEKYVSYLKMDGSRGAAIQLDNLKLNQQLAYTVMLWFKPMGDSWRSRYQYAFSFTDSLECYFTASANLMCQSDQMIDKLQVDVSTVQENQWTHLTVSGGLEYGSYLLMEQNLAGQIGYDNQNYLSLVQKTNDWVFCLGSCTNTYAFQGGFRELAIANSYITKAQATRVRNHYLLWDKSIIAYYRFSEKNLLKEEFKRIQIKQQSSFTGGRDYIPNDICWPILDFYQFFQFQSSTQHIRPFNIDNRWNPSDNNWGYTVTLRVMFNSNTCFALSPSQAISSCHLLLLNDAFMLYSPAPNQVAAYFFNKKTYLEYRSRSVFVPEGQWVNIQFTGSKFYGYEFRTYDVLGRLMDTVSEVRNFNDQNVKTKQLSLFMGTSLLVKDLRLFTSKRVLPLEFPDQEESMEPPLVSNQFDCLVYFTFTPQSIVKKGSWDSFINYCPSQAFGSMDALIQTPLTLSSAYYKENIYNSGFRYGLLTTTQALFDGIACKDDSLTPRLTSNSSYITSTVQTIPRNLPNVTVEFWFKVDTNRTQFLTTLWARSRSHEFFSIFLDSTNALLCAPFGIDSVRSPSVTFTDYTESNRISQGWFHLACSYESQKEVNGYLYSKNVDASQTKSLSNDSTILQSDTYEIYIGNNKSLNQGTAGFSVKEFRFWGIKRSISEIKEWRNKQIDPRRFTANQLYGYFRMSDGSYNDDNFIYMINPNLTDYKVSYQGVAYIQPKEALVICPINTYLSDDMQCYQNPIQYLIAAAYPEYNSTSNTLNWLFSSSETIVLSPQTSRNTLTVNWMFQDDIVNMIAAQNNVKDQPNMRLASTSFREENYYQVNLNYSNSDLTYLELYPLTFVPNSCKFYLLNSTNSYQDYLNYSQPQTLFDISFTLKLVQRKTYCNEISFFNQISQIITYQTSPPLIVNVNFQYTFNADNSITITLPKVDQILLPVQRDIQFIFKIAWTNTQIQQQLQNKNQQLTFQNIRYTIRFNSIENAIIPSLNANSTNVLIGDSVLLDASQTIVTYTTPQDLDRLSFNWICPAFLTSYCSFGNPSKLFISSTEFSNYKGQLNRNYTFTLNITYTKPNNSGSISSQISVTIMWVNIPSTSFSIKAPEQITSTASDQQLSLSFMNYNASQLPSDIKATWSIIPNITKGTYSQNNTVLTVAKDGFAQMTAYSIEVTVVNSTAASLTQRKANISFQTKQPPFGGQVNINPKNGFVNQTELTIQLVNWQSSNQPIKYKVFSTTSSNGTQTKSQLTLDWILSTQTFTFIPTDTNPYIVQITDNSGEVATASVTANIRVQNINNSNSTNQTNNTQALTSLLSLPTSSLKFQQLTAYVQSDLSQGSTLDSQTQSDQKQLVIQSLALDSSQLSSDDSSEEDQRTISKGSLQVLSVILQDPTQLPTEAIQQSLDIVQQIQKQNPATYKQLKKDSAFKNSLAQVVSGLMKFTKSLFSFGRNLQQEDITQITDQVRQLKDSLLQQLCEDASANSIQQEIVTSSFNLLVQKFTMDTQFMRVPFLFKDDGISGLNFEINQIAPLLNQYQQVEDAFCIQSTFYKLDPSINQIRNVLTQYSSSIFEYKVTDDIGINVYQSSEYNPSQNVDISFLINDTQSFKNNQSVCMAYDQNKQKWSDSPCLTSIDPDSLLINCQCNMIDTVYYAVFTDGSRIEGEPIQFPVKNQTLTPNSTQGQQEDQITNANKEYFREDRYASSQSYAFLAVVLFILLLSIIIPAIAIRLDKLDFNQVKAKLPEKHHILLLNKAAKLSQKPFAYLYYRQEEVIGYSFQYKTLFSLFFINLHPVISLFSRYDPLKPRIWRVATYFLQLGIFAWISLLVFGFSYREEEEFRIVDGLDSKDINNILLVSFGGMILLLPWENLILKSDRVRDYNESSSSKLSRKNTYLQEQEVIEEIHEIHYSPQKESQKNQKTIQMNHTYNNSNEVMINNNIDLIDTTLMQIPSLSIERKQKALKYLVIILAFLLIESASLVLIYQSLISSLKLTPANQYCIVASFYIGLLGSMVVTNMLRVLINTWLVSSKKDHNTVVRCLFISQEALEIAEEREIVRQAKEEIKSIEGQSFSIKRSYKERRDSSLKQQTQNDFSKKLNIGVDKEDEAQSKQVDQSFDSVAKSKGISLKNPIAMTHEDLKPSLFNTQDEGDIYLKEPHMTEKSPPSSNQQLDDFQVEDSYDTQAKQMKSDRSPSLSVGKSFQRSGEKKKTTHDQQLSAMMQKYSSLQKANVMSHIEFEEADQ